jgi:hypothetical protein
MLGRLPSGWERALLAVTRVDSRASPFEIQDPLEIAGTVRLALPSGYSARIVGLGRDKSISPFLEWSAETESGSDEFVVRFSVSRARGVFPPEEYSAYATDVMQALRFFDQSIEVSAPPP